MKKRFIGRWQTVGNFFFEKCRIASETKREKVFMMTTAWLQLLSLLRDNIFTVSFCLSFNGILKMSEENSYCLLALISVLYWNYTGLQFQCGASENPAWEYCGCTGAMGLEMGAGALQLHHITPLEKYPLPWIMLRECDNPSVFVLNILLHFQVFVYKVWALHLVKDCLNQNGWDV